MTGKRSPLHWRPKQVSRSTAALIHDGMMAALAFGLAVALAGPPAASVPIPAPLPGSSLVADGVAFTGVAVLVFHAFGLHRRPWRRTTLGGLRHLLPPVTLAVLIHVLLMVGAGRMAALPGTLPVLTWILLAVLLAVPRLAVRVRRERRWAPLLRRDDDGERPRLLLIGAGGRAEAFLDALRAEEGTGGGSSAGAAHDVLGLVSIGRRGAPRAVQGVPVLGALDQMPALLERLRASGDMPRGLVLTRDDLDPDVRRWLFEQAAAHGLGLDLMPSAEALRSGAAGPLDLRPVAIEDLVGHTVAPADRAPLEALLRGRRVLVTGGGSVIGGAVAGAVAACGPARLVLLDSAEDALADALHGLDRRMGEGGVAAVLVDVRDRERIDAVMMAERPDLVFHCAALRNVAVVEANPVEGVLTNVCGTRIVADACVAAGVGAMVLVSGAEAVNPTTVLDAAGRVAEQYCQALDEAQGATRAVVVRTGGILEDAGSPVRRFRRQLAEGGPLTVGHPDMTRYLMSAGQAAELVLHAAALTLDSGGFHGHVFVLDRGKPVRLADLARQMIRLAGRRPGVDVAVAVIGLRPGEKLAEEVFDADDPPVPTQHEGILVAGPRTVPWEALYAFLDRVEICARAGDVGAVMDDLRALVPDYDPPSPPPPFGAAGDA